MVLFEKARCKRTTKIRLVREDKKFKGNKEIASDDETSRRM